MLLPCRAAASEGTTWASIGKVTNIYGSLGLEKENYRYDTTHDSRDRSRLRTRFDVNGRGYIWDHRFAVFDTGITLQREKVQTRSTASNGDTKLNLLGYRLTTTWFANRPHPLTVYASRGQNTVSDFWSPSYELTTTTLGARWGMENRWLGRTGFYFDRSASKSTSTLVPRSEQNLSLGMDATQKMRSERWGESDISLGYRHTRWDEQVYGGRQRQHYIYLSDHTQVSETTNATANLTYYNRNDHWGYAGSEGGTMKSSFLGLNSALTVQKSEHLRYNLGLGLGMNDAGGSKNTAVSLTGGTNYRFNDRWQVTASLGLSESRSEAPAYLGEPGRRQQTNSLFGSGLAMYSSMIGNYLVSGGYTLAFTQSSTRSTESEAVDLPAQHNTTHTAQLGYTRMNSPRYADSLQFRVSRTRGEPSGSESNIRYSVTSLLTQNDMLQGSLERRNYQQESATLSNDINNPNYYYYAMNSKSTRMDFGWLHRFSARGSATVSAGATSGQTQGIATDTRYWQVRTALQLRNALYWTALARTEQIEGFQSIAGRKTTIESDLIYPFGKWEASVRYRRRDARMEFAPFKEHSITFFLKRNFGFRR